MGKKRVVVWGTGVVGSMVIAEILDHPVFELVGVGVTRSERAGQDVGSLLGLPETGVLTTTSVDELMRGPTAVAFCRADPAPVAKKLQDVARDYEAQGVRFLQINSNNAEKYPRDSVESMRARVNGAEFAGPYLVDESQEVARAWGATVTPDVFVTDAGGVVYRGAPDADYNDPSLDAGWLRAALEDVLAGRPVAKAETKPVGCSIKWK